MNTINPDHLLSEEDFAPGMSETVLPCLAKRETRLTVSGKDNKSEETMRQMYEFGRSLKEKKEEDHGEAKQQ